MSNHKLIMQTAASRWHDATPVGNGAIGALVHGRIAKETILINHERLWYKGIIVNDLPDVAYLLPEVRKLMDEKRYHEANLLYNSVLTEKNLNAYCPSYHMAGDLLLEHSPLTHFTKYSRDVDLETAVANVYWSENDIDYSRSCFVSQSDDVCVVELKSSEANSINSKISLVPHRFADSYDYNGVALEVPIKFKSSIAESGNIHFLAQYTLVDNEESDNGKKYGMVAKVINNGGETIYNSESIEVKNANSVLILLKLFIYEDDEAKAFKRLDSELENLPHSFETLCNSHAKIHSELYNRCKFELETDTQNSYNEELLLKAYNGIAPLELIVKMTNFGRYLLICSSRKNGLPANLQGVWNGDYQPAWNCFYLIDENVQMNYWQSLSGQLPETLMSVIDFYFDFMEDFRQNAQKLYGCRGIWVTPFLSPESGVANCSAACFINWLGGGPWIAQHFYDYYLYTLDQEYLRDKAMPFMVELATFIEDFITYDQNGKVEISPSISQENWPHEFNNDEHKAPHGRYIRVTKNATMDIALIKELLTNCITGANTLCKYQDRVEKWQEIINDLPEYMVNSDGAVSEWTHNDFSDNYHHRHQSHIYPVFPGFEINERNNRALHDAFKVAIDKRMVIGLEDQCGWSFAHMSATNARLGYKKQAIECLDIIAQACVGPNFFSFTGDNRYMGITSCETKFKDIVPFQIDANMGWVAAIYEMLFFAANGEIVLFPALPDRFKRGSISKLRCRGGFDLSLEWDLDKNFYKATIQSTIESEISLIKPDKTSEKINFKANEVKVITGKFNK